MNKPEISHNYDRDSEQSFQPWEPTNPVKNEAIYLDSLPTYHEFFTDIFLKNQLCVLGPSSTDSWTSRKLWVTSKGIPNLEFLRQHFGTAMAPTTNCDRTDCSANTKYEMTVSDFIDYWEEYMDNGHPSSDECLYLKDWHFTRDFPAFHAYTPPSLLCSDWLNEFWDTRKDIQGAKEMADDYRFVYLGPKNTWTPFHSDVLRSYSWSANICGRKKWIFFPPGAEENLRDQYGQLIQDLRNPSVKDRRKYPKAENVMADKPIVVIQSPGEIVFVPSGWHHQVFNLEDTISINHNWINGCSAHLTWAYLKSQLARARQEIADCADMDCFDSQCQRILKADSGMNYIEFYNFLATVAIHRLTALNVFHQHVVGSHRKNNDLDVYGAARDSDKDEDVSSSKPVRIKDCSVNFTLCLWHTALYNFPDLCSRTGTKNTSNHNIKDDIIIELYVQKDKISFSPPSTVTPTSSSNLSPLQCSELGKNQVTTGESNGYDIDCSDFSKTTSISQCPELNESAKVTVESNSCDVYCSDFSKMKKNSNNSACLLSEVSNVLGSSIIEKKGLWSSSNLKSSSGSSSMKTSYLKNSDLKKSDESRKEVNSDGDLGEYKCSKRELGSRHERCPHWSHCGPRLAVFDLQRILSILQDVTSQLEWKNIVEEASKDGKVGCVLFEEYSVLRANIEECIGKVMKYLS